MGRSTAAGVGQFTAPGWVRDENGALRRETKPRMNRRLPGFDYSQRMIYEITIVLEERRPILGRLVKTGETWSVEPTSLGLAVLALEGLGTGPAKKTKRGRRATRLNSKL